MELSRDYLLEQITQLELEPMTRSMLVFGINNMSDEQIALAAPLMGQLEAAHKEGGRAGVRAFLESLSAEFNAPPGVIDLIMEVVPDAD